MNFIYQLKERLAEPIKHVLVIMLFLAFFICGVALLRDAPTHSNGGNCNQNVENA